MSFPAAPDGWLRKETALPKWRWGSMSFCYVICHRSITENSDGKWRICSVSGSSPCWSLVGVALWKEPLTLSIRISRGTSVLLGSGQSHTGREGLMKSCLLLCPILCRHSTKDTGWESPLKALKSPKWSFWNILSHPPSLRSQQPTWESGEPQQITYWHLLHHTFLILNKNPREPSEAWWLLWSGKSCFANLSEYGRSVLGLAEFHHALRNR